MRRKQEQNAAAGRPHKGSIRPFGYESDHATIRADEANVIQQIAARFLAGESTRSIATWLNDQQVPTVKGGSWVTTTIKGILVNPRYAGLLRHRGEIVGPGAWEPVLSEDDHRRILARFAARKISGRRAPQRYVLSGMTRCGKCGHTLLSAARGETRRYECRSGPDHGGCGGLTVVADPVERLVCDFVLYRLDTPELAEAMSGRDSADARTRELSGVVAQATEQLEELATGYADQSFSMAEWLAARAPIQQRLDSAQKRLARVTQSTALVGLVGSGRELGSAWGSLNLGRQRAIVEALVDHVVIGPGTLGATRFDPARVSVVWRR